MVCSENKKNMEMQIILLGLIVCGGILNITNSAPVKGPLPHSRNQSHNKTVFDYNLQVKLESGQILQEKLKINTKAKTEYVSVPKHGEEEEMEVLEDFSKNLTAIHVKARNVCYIYKIVLTTPPAVFQAVLDNDSISDVNVTVMKTTTTNWKVDELFTQRSLLSEEMAVMCARSSIYWIQKMKGTGSRQSRDTVHLRAARSPCKTVRVCYPATSCTIVTLASGQRRFRCATALQCHNIKSC